MIRHELERLPIYQAGIEVQNTSNTADNLRLSLYSNQDAETWARWIAQGDLSKITIYTLHTVGAGPTPIRWLVNTIQPAMLVETLEQVGIIPPSQWKTMAPFTINAWANLLDSDSASTNSQRLHALSQEYINLSRPNSIKPELEIDNEDSTIELFKHGNLLFHQLPPNVKEELQRMAKNHQNGYEPEEESKAAYLLAHFNAYGHLEIPGGFAPRNDALIILPQSESKFLKMMSETQISVENLGIGPIRSFADRNCVVMLSQVLRTPHYYPHNGEPTLEDLAETARWPSTTQIYQGRINGLAKEEIAQALELIDADLGDKRSKTFSYRRDRLIDVTRSTLSTQILYP